MPASTGTTKGATEGVATVVFMRKSIRLVSGPERAKLTPFFLHSKGAVEFATGNNTYLQSAGKPRFCFLAVRLDAARAHNHLPMRTLHPSVFWPFIIWLICLLLDGPFSRAQQATPDEARQRAVALYRVDPSAPRKPLFTSFDGTRIHYQVQGKGKPVVLAHGFIVHSATWSGPHSTRNCSNTVIG
jgi:hypothetical protein